MIKKEKPDESPAFFVEILRILRYNKSIKEMEY